MRGRRGAPGFEAGHRVEITLRGAGSDDEAVMKLTAALIALSCKSGASVSARLMVAAPGAPDPRTGIIHTRWKILRRWP